MGRTPHTAHHPDIHHPRRSPPQTFTTPCVKSDVHHPRRSPPQTFTTSDVHHPRQSPPPDVHHLRHSPPQTFTTSDIHYPRHSSPPKEKFTNRQSIHNVPAVQTTLHQGSRGQSKQCLMIFETVKHGKQCQ